jgi:hypothetical protein
MQTFAIYTATAFAECNHFALTESRAERGGKGPKGMFVMVERSATGFLSACMVQASFEVMKAFSARISVFQEDCLAKSRREVHQRFIRSRLSWREVISY